MRLEALVAPRFRIDAAGRSADLRALLARAAEHAPSIEQLGEPGSVVAVPAGDPAELLAWLEAAWSTGRTPLPLTGIHAPCRMDLPPTSAALVLRTSGSTGAPRFPEFDGRAVLRSARTIADYLDLSPSDRVALVQPLEHGFGLVGQLFAAACAGASVVWASSPFPDERAESVVEARATVVAAVPFLLGQLLEFGFAAAPLRSIGSAGGPLPRRLAEQLVEASPSAIVWNQYGCTEAGPRLTACPSTSAAFAAGALGKPISGVAVRATPDEGRIVFQSPMAMRGYLGDPEATAAARAGEGFYTGDVGYLDGEGNLYVTGRSDEVVKVRGLKISLGAVAQAIEACGARAAVALVLDAGAALTDRDVDGTLCAVFEGERDIPLAALAERLPLQALPSRLLRVPALPRLTSGKVDRAAIPALTRALMARRSSAA